MPDLTALTSKNWRERRRAIERLAQADSASLAQRLLTIIRENHQDLGALNGALQLLSLLKTPVTEGLSVLLRDPDPETRTYAALALGETHDPAAVPALLEVVAETPGGGVESNLLFNAIEALGKLRARSAVETLTEIARGGDFYLAFPAIRALAEIGDPRPAPVLAAMLDHELLSFPAVEALGAVGDVEAIPAITAWLESALGDAGPAVLGLTTLAARLEGRGEEGLPTRTRIGASIGPLGRAKLLAVVPPPAAAAVPTEGLHFLPRLGRLLGWILSARLAGDEGGDKSEAAENARLRRALASLFAYPMARRQAAEGLAAAGKAAIPELVEVLDNADAEVGRIIMRILLDLADPESISALIKGLDAEDEEVAALAGEALGIIGRAHPQESGRLYEALLSRLAHPSPRVRCTWAGALRAIGLPEHESRMRALYQRALYQRALNQKDGEALREAAIYALAGTRDREAVGIVLQAVNDPAPGVRQAAIEILPGIDPVRAQPVLEQAADDPNPRVRARAIRALAHCPPEFALPRLHQALQDPDPWVRLQTCHALGEIARPESLAALAAMRNDPMPPVRIALAETLIKIGSEPAIELVRELLADPEIDVHQAIQSALGASTGRSS
jgi:HEAT repeat protein